MNELGKELRKLAAALPQSASEDVEQRLLTAFRARHRAGKRWWIYLAAAACVAVTAGLFLARPKAVATDPYPPAGFVALPYGQSGVPMEQPVIVRVDIPASELNVMGLPARAGGGNERVSAELLVGQDGVARAVRFVQ
ncbi:MAG TPA: hypothetical protein VGL97_00815 [Bryobacteraceae bacterium]